MKKCTANSLTGSADALPMPSDAVPMLQVSRTRRILPAEKLKDLIERTAMSKHHRGLVGLEKSSLFLSCLKGKKNFTSSDDFVGHFKLVAINLAFSALSALPPLLKFISLNCNIKIDEIFVLSSANSKSFR